MDLNFSKKTRKIVASLLAVAILLGVLPVSGLTGNSSGAEGNNGSANTIFVKSDHQPVLFDSNGNVKSVLTKKDGTYTGTNVNSSDQIVFLRNDVAKGITVGNTIVFYKKSSNTSTTDDAEPYDRIHVWKENGEPYKEWKSDDAIMKKYSGNLYYYIYPSDKNKVIFHNGLNDDEVGVKKSKEWDLNEWQVYTKNGLAGSLLNTLPTCKVGDNNAFSYYSGKITSEKIEKSDKFGATVTDVAGNESDVFKNDKITFYKFLTSKENSEALIDNVKVNDVDGFKGVVTAQKLKEDCTEVEYTYTYTDNTYGIKFTDTKTVNYTFEAPLSVSGKWNVKVNDEEVTDENNKLYCKDEASFNKITVSFDNAKVTYGGKEISVATNDSATEDGSLKSEYFLNDKKISSDSLNIQTDSNKSEDENILKVKYSYTVNGKTYETFETFTFYCYVDSTAPEITSFEFATVESDVDKVLSFLTFGIYNNDQVVVTVNAEDKNISSGIKKISLYNGDTLLNTQEFGEYISNGSATFTLNKSDELYKLYAVAEDKADNCGKKWTFNLKDHNENCYKPIEYNPDKGNTLPELVSYGGIDKFSDLTVTPENFKHQDNKGLFSYKKNGELFNIKLSESLSALSEATVTVNKDGSAKSFSETITFDTTSEDAKKKDCKLDYDLKLAKVFNDIGVSGSDISGKYTIKVKATNNAGVSCEPYTYDFSIDNTAPVITLFAIENGSQNPIVDETSSQEYRYYFQHNTNVTVTAKDSASGVKEIHFRAYDVVKKDNAVDETKTVSSNNNAVFEVPANFKGEIYAYAVDKFDNSSIDKNIQGEGEKKPDDLIVETQQHHNGNASVTMSRAKASYKDNSGLDLYSGNVNARVVFEDAYAGIKDATITVYDYKNDVTGTIYAEIGNDGSIKKTEVTGSVNNIIFNDDYTTSKDNLLPKLVIDYVVTDNSNNIKITTSMTDRAGNKTDNVKDSLSIDKTKPVIDVKYDNNEHTTYGGNDYYKADRTATVTVTERNFDESLVEAAIMRNGGR